ncbi:Prorelaxin H2, partial [Saguinus oedipus]
IMPSFDSKDTETINMMSELIANLPQELKAAPSGRQSLLPELQQHVPILKDSDLSSEEFKEIIHNRQSEATDSSPSELKYLDLHAYSRRKRQFSLALFINDCKTSQIIATLDEARKSAVRYGDFNLEE